MHVVYVNKNKGKNLDSLKYMTVFANMLYYFP